MNQVQGLVQKICREIATPAAHALAAAVGKGEWAHAQCMRLGPPHTYASAHAYRDDLFIVEFVRKLAFSERTSREARFQAAVDTFYKSEAMCHRTNGYFKHLRQGYLSTNDLRVNEFITHWRQIISTVLGPLPRSLTPRYSPGSTLSDSGMSITIPDKMSSSLTYYPHSQAVVLHTIAGTELDKDYVPRPLRRGNRFFTVPKDALKDRGCCVEASGNIVSQLAIGALIRSRYDRFYKVDLSQMQPVHRLAAKLASEGAGYATIDLSMASDTVSLELVRAVLPSGWADLLESLRATHTRLRGKYVRLEKFSSMGNGFTFELETLLFRTLLTALGVGDDDALVYGDDIILPEENVAAMVSALRRFGFETNERKTFSEGPFRESCGGDFFLGHDVRAVYLKKAPDEPQDWVVLHNQLYRWGGGERLRAARHYCIDQIPVSHRSYGPVTEGDLWLHDRNAEAQPLGPRGLGKKYAMEGLVPASLGFWGNEPISRQITLSHKWFAPQVVIAAALMGCGEQINLRDSVIGYKRSFKPAYGLGDRRAMEVIPGLITWLDR